MWLPKAYVTSGYIHTTTKKKGSSSDMLHPKAFALLLLLMLSIEMGGPYQVRQRKGMSFGFGYTLRKGQSLDMWLPKAYVTYGYILLRKG